MRIKVVERSKSLEAIMKLLGHGASVPKVVEKPRVEPAGKFKFYEDPPDGILKSDTSSLECYVCGCVTSFINRRVYQRVCSKECNDTVVKELEERLSILGNKRKHKFYEDNECQATELPEDVKVLSGVRPCPMCGDISVHYLKFPDPIIDIGNAGDNTAVCSLECRTMLLESTAERLKSRQKTRVDHVGQITIDEIELDCSDGLRRTFKMVIGDYSDLSPHEHGGMTICFYPVNENGEANLEADFTINWDKGLIRFCRKRGRMRSFYEYLCTIGGQLSETLLRYHSKWEFNLCDAKNRLTIPFGANTWDLSQLDENGEHTAEDDKTPKTIEQIFEEDKDRVVKYLLSDEIFSTVKEFVESTPQDAQDGADKIWKALISKIIVDK